MKGFKCTLIRIIEKIGGKNQDLEKTIEKLINKQNLQSTSCIKAIGGFLRNHKKNIKEDDLRNPIETYQTNFEFLNYDIQRYREQGIKHECFQVLHPWAYDLDAVDIKYIVNNNLEKQICGSFGLSDDAQIFWLSFFKPQLSCSADEFFEAVRQLYEMANLPGQFASQFKTFEAQMSSSSFVISVEKDSALINETIAEMVNRLSSGKGSFNPLTCQFKTCDSKESCYNKVGAYSFNPGFTFDLSKFGASLSNLKLIETSHPSCDLQRKLIHIRANQIPKQRLKLKFEAVDTEELKNIEISVDGDHAIYKVGEGETSNYHIPNDKKLWETQFIVCSKNGQYFLRDMGFVHNSRVKLDSRCEVQIQRDSVVDLGKVVHYHFDKVVHEKIPDQASNEGFYVLRPELGNYECADEGDLPEIRARPVWVSSDEIQDNIQKEIFVDTMGSKRSHSLGRSMKRDIQIKLKAVSADHCGIHYSP